MRLLLAMIVLAVFLLSGCSPATTIPSESTITTQGGYTFRWSTPDDPYLTRLRDEYQLEGVVADAAYESERVRLLSQWVRSRWEHNGDNEPTQSDPVSILKEAEEGNRFRCVEYSIVLAGALNSVGIPARVLGLKTEDVETRPIGAGHVVVEAYLADLDKWILVDGQWDVIPVLDGTPLSALELQQALAENERGLRVDSFSKPDSTLYALQYFAWLQPYLYYYDVAFDNRYSVERELGSLMLVPEGAKEPVVFQRNSPILHTVYTTSVEDFYAAPEGY